MSFQMHGTRGDVSSIVTGGLPLTDCGQLACGIHDFTLAQLRPLVATTPYRRAMWARFITFMGWPIMVNRFSHAYVGGGFVSLKEQPRDIDLILQTRCPYGPEAFQVLERFFSVGLETIHDTYTIHLHFWMENAPPGFSDYRIFFQYTRPEKQHPEKNRRALIRLSLLDPDIKRQFRDQLDSL